MPKEMVVKRRRNKGNIDNDRSSFAKASSSAKATADMPADMTIAIIPQHSMEKADSAKIEVLEEYYNYNSMALIPITTATLYRLLGNGIKWAREIDDAIKLSQFQDMNGISKRTWQRWREKHKWFDEGTEQILTILGNKREAGLLTRKYEPGSTIFMMPHYDDDWGKMCEWRANLKPKEGIVKSGETFVVIEKYPESDLVPAKKDE